MKQISCKCQGMQAHCEICGGSGTIEVLSLVEVESITIKTLKEGKRYITDPKDWDFRDLFLQVFRKEGDTIYVDFVELNGDLQSVWFHMDAIKKLAEYKYQFIAVYSAQEIIKEANDIHDLTLMDLDVIVQDLMCEVIGSVVTPREFQGLVSPLIEKD